MMMDGEILTVELFGIELIYQEEMVRTINEGEFQI